MNHDQMQKFGSLSLGSRLKRLSDRLMQDVTQIYQARGLALNPSFFPLFNLLLQNGALSVTEAAEMLGVSHPAVSKVARKMMDEGWLNKKADPSDERRQQMYLTDQSNCLLEEIQPVWHEIKSYLDELMDRQEDHFLRSLNDFERRIDQEGFVSSVLERLNMRSRVAEVRIAGWQPELKRHFQRLNQNWLDRYFDGELTELDKQALGNPESYYLAKGGYIWFAGLNDRNVLNQSNPESSPAEDSVIVGTVALARHSAELFEISKMGVAADIQGMGIGRQLLLVALDKARELGAKEVYLESATKLERAIRLYRNMGFVEIPHPDGKSVYPRSDIYMTLTL
ncbi:bifunctional helix-turn-helix transcriptional regulator/GNAT family N-acetyltransferase [Oceanospirillum sediminis]|nr:bifunctional helix-turn-helix transcriptional regulator/GNAT family N-acetyltransferase [Oceanospirillum sediminis]